MEGANFENKLKDNLENYSSPLDLELEWADLDTRRNKKRKKRPFFWIWWAAGIILLSGSIFIFMNGSEDLINSTDNEFIVEGQNQKEVFSNKQNHSSSTNEQDELTSPATFSSSEKASEETSITFKKDNTLGPSKNIAANNINQVKYKEQSKSDFLTTERNVQSTPDLIKIKSNIEDLSSTFYPVIINTNQPSLKPSIDQKDTPVSLLPSKHLFVQVIKSFPFLEFEIIPKTSGEKNPKKKSNWVLGISASYGKSFRNLTALNENLVPLADRRNLAEEAIDVWQTSLIFRKNINDKWFMDLGIGYAQSVDRFKDIKTEFSNPIIENHLISITHLINGNTIEEMGDVIADRTMVSDNTFYQYQGNVFIKLASGRNFVLNEKSGFSFSTGLKLNTYTFKQGEAFIENNDFYGDLKDYDFRKVGIINTSSNLEYYRITKNKVRLAFGLEGEFQLNNTFLKKSGLNEKRNTLGFSVSVMKPF